MEILNQDILPVLAVIAGIIGFLIACGSYAEYEKKQKAKKAEFTAKTEVPVPQESPNRKDSDGFKDDGHMYNVTNPNQGVYYPAEEKSAENDLDHIRSRNPNYNY